MRIVASVRDREPSANVGQRAPRVGPEDFRAYRIRLAMLRTRAPDTLRARIRRELRAAADRAARR